MPRITPICVIAGVVIVGESELTTPRPDAAAPSSILASPKSSTFTVPSSRIFTLAGLRSRWMIPCSCAASSASAICVAMGECLIDRNRALCNSVGERRPFHELHDKGADAIGLFQAVNDGDIRVVQ